MKDLKKNLWQLFHKFWPLILIILIVSSFFWKVFLQNKVPLPGDFIVGIYYPWLDYKWGYPVGVPVKNPIAADVVSFMYPMQITAVSLLKKGILPLWNPYILTGSPLLANFQSAPFTITNFLYFIFEKNTAWSFQIIFQHLIAALGLYLLLRDWNISKMGSVLGGILFAFSGFNLIWSQWNGHTLTGAFIPIELYLLDNFLTKAKLKHLVGLSFIICFQILSGYPQVMLYSFLSLGILFLIKIPNQNQKFIKTILLGLFVILGLGLSSPQTLPGKELLSTSQREVEPHPYEWAFLPYQKIITFIAPDYFGNHTTANYWGPQDYTSNTGFVGVIGVILFILSLNLLKKRKEVQFATILGIVSLFLAFPTVISIWLWKSGVLGLSAAAAHRSLIIFNLAIAIGSGFGLDYLINTKKPKIKWPLVVPGAIFLVFFLLALNQKDFNKSVALKNLILPISIFTITSVLLIFKIKLKIIFLLLLTTELFYFGWKFTSFTQRSLIYPETPVISFLKSQKGPFRTTGDKVIPINLRMAYGLESPEGYDAVYPLRISKFVSAINNNLGEFNSIRRYAIIDNDTSFLLDLINTKYYLSLKNNTDNFDKKRFNEVFSDKSVVVFESKSVLPRSFMIYNWETEKDENQVLKKLSEKNFPLNSKIILEEDLNKTKNDEVVKNEVKYLDYQTQMSKIKVNTSSDGMLFTSDEYFPGWHAYIDNVETNIYIADFAFRSIFVPKGEHIIQYIYKPDSFFEGLKISEFSLISIGIIVLILRSKNYNW